MNNTSPFDTRREFPLTEDNYLYLSGLATANTGIVLGHNKVEMVYTRLCRRLRQLGLSSFDEYIGLLKQDTTGDEISVLVNSLTTNLTAFYRTLEHFEHMGKIMFPEAAARIRKGAGKRIRIWSAGCSTGEEPFSVAMTATNSLGNHLKNIDLKILATDIDTRMLSQAAKGAYSDEALKNVGAADRLKFFHSKKSAQNDNWKIRDTVRTLVTYKRLNLLEKWPMSGPFDAIMCRNVMIYFDAPVKQRLVSRLTDFLRPGGCLYLGSSESVTFPCPNLKREGSSIYRRVN